MCANDAFQHRKFISRAKVLNFKKNPEGDKILKRVATYRRNLKRKCMINQKFYRFIMHLKNTKEYDIF